MGFGVWSLGSGVWDIGSGVWDSGFGGLGSRVQRQAFGAL